MSLLTVQKQYSETILDGMARMLWVLAYADWVDQGEFELEDGQEPPLSPEAGGDWDDVTPETPHAALLAANDLAKLIAKSEGFDKEKYPLANLFELAMTVDRGQAFEFGDDESELAEEFGGDLAHMGLGTGVSWFDDHKSKNKGAEWNPKFPWFECHYDGSDLTWSGGTQQARYHPFESDGDAASDAMVFTGAIGSRNLSTGEQHITFVNQELQNTAKHSYVLTFGGGSTILMVYADNLDEALEYAAEWIEEHAPGLFADDAVNEEYTRLLNETGDEEAAQQASEVDVTPIGAHFVHSHEWGIVAEDPSKLDLLRIAGLIKNPSTCGRSQ